MSENEKTSKDNVEKKQRNKVKVLFFVLCFLLAACCLLSLEPVRGWLCKTGIEVFSTGELCFGIKLLVSGH